jgi:hypothetical protein
MLRCSVWLRTDEAKSVVRGCGPAGKGGQLDQYVNDRPYAANSFLSVALGQLFTTAMSGRSKERQELAETDIASTLCCDSPESQQMQDTNLLHYIDGLYGYAMARTE